MWQSWPGSTHRATKGWRTRDLPGRPGRGPEAGRHRVCRAQQGKQPHRLQAVSAGGRREGSERGQGSRRLCTHQNEQHVWRVTEHCPLQKSEGGGGERKPSPGPAAVEGGHGTMAARWRPGSGSHTHSGWPPSPFSSHTCASLEPGLLPGHGQDHTQRSHGPTAPACPRPALGEAPPPLPFSTPPRGSAAAAVDSGLSRCLSPGCAPSPCRGAPPLTAEIPPDCRERPEQESAHLQVLWSKRRVQWRQELGERVPTVRQLCLVQATG